MTRVSRGSPHLARTRGHAGTDPSGVLVVGIGLATKLASDADRKGYVADMLGARTSN